MEAIQHKIGANERRKLMHDACMVRYVDLVPLLGVAAMVKNGDPCYGYNTRERRGAVS